MSAWVTPLRVVFGLFLVLTSLNHFAGAIVPEPLGTQPLAVQLMTALHDSRLYDVAMGFELLAGVLLLAGVAVPFALCMALPIQVCALFWALILGHDFLWSAVAVIALAANTALMFSHLGAYRGVLQRRALAFGEGPALGDNYDGLYMHLGPRQHLTTRQFITAALVLAAAMAFYWYLVPSVTGQFARLVILVPAILLALRGTSVRARRA
ncbi:MAG: hypothetical protein ABIT09_00360 [Croceibacterium sp.]